MIERNVIRALQAVGIALIIYSGYLLAFRGVLLSASGIEYGIILFGVGCTASAIRLKRVDREEYKD